LGAGSQGNTDYDQGRDTSFAIGTVKFLLSTELRFPIYGFLEGAVFVDGGNIFLSGGLEDLQENDGTGFSMNSLVKNMALGTGFGIRLNLDYFVLRADVGVKMRDPGLIGVRSPWVIQDVAWRPRNWTFNIALGYPF
jgi:outer membrane protein assembly factor BamA